VLEGLLQSIRARLGARKRSSALYTFLNTNAITTGEEIVMDLETGLSSDFSIASGTTSEIQALIPFTNASVANGDTTNPIRLTPNNEPGHSVVALPRASADLEDMSIFRFKVTNLGSGTIAAGAVIVTLWIE
jgi:hypothetical protein